ncbi:MAG: hypothetical protein HLUCCA11_06475 [Phormidesmis priestleyi Ana]|uniref:Uncharacterized protein n=1 Tax=Phormidesmis priestleyi Ana TaxID=1666911 RepID=A0A0P8A0R1_9CYAN|nr:MAG: hypothetical protein HLUCCA11_06475 [Phormidesmis priestleyi Ana]
MTALPPCPPNLGGSEFGLSQNFGKPIIDSRDKSSLFRGGVQYLQINSTFQSKQRNSIHIGGNLMTATRS